MKKKLFALLLVLCLSIGLLAINASAAETCGDNLTWSVSGGVLTISGTGAMDDFTTNTIPWRSHSSDITSVVIKEGVSTIGNSAFYNLYSLTSVTIPDSVCKIGACAFQGCQRLESVTIPDSVRDLNNYAFRDCRFLSKVTFCGDQPIMGWDVFLNVGDVTFYYPAGNDTYDNGVLSSDYGAMACTWKSYTTPTITADPVSVTADPGTTAKFTVSASGSGLSYQWQYRTSPDQGWLNASATGNKTKTLTVSVTLAKSGYQYRCKVTNSSGRSISSAPATLNVVGINTHPADAVVEAKTTAEFTISATGTDLSYQWQYRTSPTGKWIRATAPGNQTDTMTVPATVAKSGYQYRCKVTAGNGKARYSNVATLYVLGIKTQPTDAYALLGNNAVFTVNATGKNLKYQWQYYRTGTGGYEAVNSGWVNALVKGNKTSTLTIPATAVRNGVEYRCKITDANGNVIYSDRVTLHVMRIRSQPKDKTAVAGTVASFKATNTGATSLQWYYRTSPTGKWLKATADGSQSVTLRVTATNGKNGYQYRCKLSNPNGDVLYTEVATLTVLGVKVQPTNQSAEKGSIATFTVTATDTGSALTYQWQYRTSPTGKWIKAVADGNQTDTMNVTATAGKNGYEYRCKITDTESGKVIYSKIVTLTVK